MAGSVDDFARDRLERVEPGLRPGGRLAYHAIGALRSLRKLQADSASQTAFFQNLQRDIERAKSRRTRIAIVVALEQADVLRPGGAARVLFLRLDGDERGLALAWEDRDVVALHAPVVGEVDDVVGRAHDQGVEIVASHEFADAGEFELSRG